MLQSFCFEILGRESQIESNYSRSDSFGMLRLKGLHERRHVVYSLLTVSSVVERTGATALESKKK